MGESGKEEQSNNNGDGKNKRNRMLGLGILFVVAAVIAIVVPAVLLNSGDDPKEAPALATATSSPTFASLFSPNSPEACAAISQGGTVPDQGEMIWKSFNLTIDVSLASDLYDYNKAADELQSRMQQIVAPELADCPDSRRLRALDGIHDANRKLLAEHAIGNVLFDLRLDSTRSCDDGAPSPCIVVNTTMVLYLKSDQNRLPLTQKVANMFEESALKGDPFALITIAGQQAVTMTPTSVPSVVPTSSPTQFSNFTRNSAEACESIANRGSVPNQGDMLREAFDVSFDLTLTLQLSDVSEVIEEFESRMQRFIAPQLAQCQGMPLFSGAIERNIIGNAKFFFESYDPEKTCAASNSICIQATARLNLFLKGEETASSLFNHVTTILGGQDLQAATQLTAPFSVIQSVAITPSDPFDPTLAPTTLTIFGDNTSEDCASIALGLPVPDQHLMRRHTFVLNFDVLLTLELSDLSEVVEFLESKMQQVIAPMLADCPAARRLRRTMDLDENERKMLEEDAIGNALFKLSHVQSKTCFIATPACIRVDATLDLFLKDVNLRIFDIVNRILPSLEGELVGVLGLSAPFAEIMLTSIFPLEITEPPSSLPSGALLYAPNSSEECAAISRGELTPSQHSMISYKFDILMDVSLTLDLSDLGEVVQEIESRLQRILGPKLADCLEERRLQETNGAEGGTVRHLQEKNLVANAIFDAVYEEDEACDASATTPCIRVLAKLTVILKGEEARLPLASRVAAFLGPEPLADVLGLAAPINTIEVVNLA
ncbi:MAG: hypothetical protein SGBAC_003154 [Bacillariaceae sp.]